MIDLGDRAQVARADREMAVTEPEGADVGGQVGGEQWIGDERPVECGADLVVFGVDDGEIPIRVGTVEVGQQRCRHPGVVLRVASLHIVAVASHVELGTTEGFHRLQQREAGVTVAFSGNDQRQRHEGREVVEHKSRQLRIDGAHR